MITTKNSAKLLHNYVHANYIHNTIVPLAVLSHDGNVNYS